MIEWLSFFTGVPSDAWNILFPFGVEYAWIFPGGLLLIGPISAFLAPLAGAWGEVLGRISRALWDGLEAVVARPSALLVVIIALAVGAQVAASTQRQIIDVKEGALRIARAKLAACQPQKPAPPPQRKRR